MLKLRSQSEKIFTVLLGLAFMSLFFGQAFMHLIGFIFLISLLLLRPKLPWIAPFWWLLAFAIWEYLSDYLGPYHGDGMESIGIAYHFLYLFLPLLLLQINYPLLLSFIGVGAVSSAVLMWLQGLIGTALHSPPLRIDWDGGKMFARPPGFNARAWVSQFNHSLVTLAILPYIKWKDSKYWLLIVGLFSGIILPQIRAVIAAFVTGIGVQLAFSKRVDNRILFIRRLMLAALIAVLLIGAIAYLRPDFMKNISTANGRDKIFATSIEVFENYPITGIGGGRHFHEVYEKAWMELGYSIDGIGSHYYIGHSHSDYLMLLVQHGWPALFLWLGFVIHALRFAWRYGDRREKVVFTSLVIMHQVAGLMETYLDYSNTTYAIALCYGLALHGPYRRYLAGRLSIQKIEDKQ